MSDCRLYWRSPLTQPAASILALALTVLGLPSCTEGKADSGCLWETDELLARANAEARDLVDCGLFLAEQPLDNDCFRNGLDAQAAVQITINNCIDCTIHSTYVSTRTGRKLHLYREADFYGDALSVVRMDSCTDFVVGRGPGANCAGPVVLYSCSAPP
jgi:hypothetical protein